MSAPFQGLTAQPENSVTRIKSELTYISPLENHFDYERKLHEFKQKLWNDYKLWATAFGIEECYKKCQQNQKILIYSHRKIGWSNPIYSLTANFSIEVKTNFGYGRSSYFFSILRYQSIEITPFSEWVEYQFAQYSDIIRYTQKYNLENGSWPIALSYCQEACNISLLEERQFISKYIIEELEKMTQELEEILHKDSFIFKNKDHTFYKVDIKGRILIEFRAEKITGALNFIRKIMQLDIIIDTKVFIKRIEASNRMIKPLLVNELGIIKKELDEFNYDMNILLPIYLDRKKKIDLFEIQKHQLMEKLNPPGDELFWLSQEQIEKKFLEIYPVYSEFETEFNKIESSYNILIQKIQNNEKIYNNISVYLNSILIYFKS